jgi:hypothetical protein
MHSRDRWNWEISCTGQVGPGIRRHHGSQYKKCRVLKSAGVQELEREGDERDGEQ